MAHSDKIKTSVHGRRLGIDDKEYMVGPHDVRVGVTTGSSAANIPAHGVTVLNATAASTFTLDTPRAGVRKYLFQAGVGSSHNVITGTTDIKIVSTLGSSQQRICLQTTGDYAELVGLSSGQWGVVSLNAGCSLTT